MSDWVIEVALWVLLAFFAGCILGYILRRIFAGQPAAAEAPGELPAAGAATAEEEHPQAAKIAAVSVPSVATESAAPAFEHSGEASEPPAQSNGEEARPLPSAPPTRNAGPKTADKGSRPKGIPAPRGGTPDPLQKISGVGPKIELTLHQLGIFHFDQIAKWTTEQQQWVDDHLKFKGRIAREEWVSQAAHLARGDGTAGEKKPARTRASSRSRKLGSP